MNNKSLKYLGIGLTVIGILGFQFIDKDSTDKMPSNILSIIFLVGVVMLIILWKRNKKEKKSTSKQSDIYTAPLKKEQNNELTFKIAGVSFNNEDGTSRTDLIYKTVKNNKYYLHINKTKFKGNNAYEIISEYGTLGHVPKSSINELEKIYEKIDIIVLEDYSTFYVDSDGDIVDLKDDETAEPRVSVTVRVEYKK